MSRNGQPAPPATGEMKAAGLQSTYPPQPSGAGLPRSQSQTEHQDSGPREGHIPGAGSQEGLDSDTPPVDKTRGRARNEKTTDAGALGLVLRQAHTEHALQKCLDDEPEIVVDLPASTNTTDKGINTSNFVSSSTLQGFAVPYVLFYAVALVGVIPRCTVLLASHALPQASASQAVTAFGDLWRSCADPANVFSDFSSRGIVYKVLVGGDHVFFGLGMMLAVVATLYLTFPEACKSRRAAWRLGMSAAVLMLLCALYFVGVLSTLLADNIAPAALDGLDWMRPIFAIVTCASTYVGYVYVALSSNIWRHCMHLCLTRSVFWKKLGMVVALSGTVALIWRIAAVLYFFEALFVSRISSVLAASAFCRSFNFLVRWLVNHDTSLPVHVANVLSMLLLSYVSLAMRRIILNESNQKPSALLVNYLTLALVETVSRCGAYFSHIVKLGKDMQHLNTRTLGELVDLHTKVLRRVDGITSYVFVDQFVEIFVFVMITSQDLSAPIWSYIRVWKSMEAWDARFSVIFLEGAIQMGVEFLVDLLIWRLCFHRLAWDLPQVTRRILFKKPVAVFTIGLMLIHSLNFFPNCMTCSWPVHCLAFTECLFDGKVMINGENACTTTLANRTNYAEIVLQETRLRTQVEISPEQLACGRLDVDCFGLEAVSR